MTPVRKLLAGTAAVVVACGLFFAGAGLLFHSFDNVGSGSPLRFLVDSEIRSVPLPDSASSIVFRCEPADGNKPQLDGASIQTSDPDKTLSVARAYFLKLGYREREGDTTLVKPQLEVRLEKTESNRATVTKYSWR